MAHPNFEHAVAICRGKVFNALEQVGVAVGANFCVTKFACGARLDFATQLFCHGLHAVADTQNRKAQFKHCIGCTIVDFVNTGV